jgi:hypothetical protein
MSETTMTEEVSLLDVWRLLGATASRLDQLYATLDITEEPLPTKPSKRPAMLHVQEHPFFGMIADAPDNVSETMARLRENRYAAL